MTMTEGNRTNGYHRHPRRESLRTACCYGLGIFCCCLALLGILPLPTLYRRARGRAVIGGEWMTQDDVGDSTVSYLLSCRAGLLSCPYITLYYSGLACCRSRACLGLPASSLSLLCGVTPTVLPLATARFCGRKHTASPTAFMRMLFPLLFSSLLCSSRLPSSSLYSPPTLSPGPSILI